MVSFVDKLLLGRELKFEEGRLSIFDQRVLIVPVELILLLIEKSVADEKFEQAIYDVMKKSVYGFCQTLAKRRGIEPKKMVDLLINLAEMNGYGKLQLINLDYDKKQAIFHMRSLPSEALLEKKLGKRIVDRYWAGMLAGGASWIFGEDVDAVETRCVADGKESCEFVVRKV
ncbi:MAG: hypothetical protein HYY22_09135 [Thaumarchaeota archaeon]|nr:hypothetical protein [Nitrososphaerota archaeon]